MAEQLPTEYTTADGHTVKPGDEVFSHYTMKAGSFASRSASRDGLTLSTRTAAATT